MPRHVDKGLSSNLSKKINIQISRLHNQQHKQNIQVTRYPNVESGGDFDIMVVVLENGYGKLNSNPDQGCLHSANIGKKV